MQKIEKKYQDGNYIYEGDLITSMGMGSGIVEWCPTNLQWSVRITKSPGGSLTENSIVPLKDFFNPIKVTS